MKYEGLIKRVREFADSLDTGNGRKFQDAAEGLFLSKQLNHVRQKVFEIRYPEMNTRKFISKAGDIPAGAETFTTYSYDEIGMAEIVTGDVKDLPSIEAKANEATGRVQWIGASYGWSFIEMIRASFAGVPLESKKAAIARRAMARAEDYVLATGGTPKRPSAITGLTGLINHPSVPDYTFAHTPWDATGVTPTEILADLNGWVHSIVETTKGLFTPKRMLLPLYWYHYLSTTPYSDQHPDSILTVFLKNNRYISNASQIETWWFLDTADAGAPMGIVYDDSSDVVEAVIPMEFTQLPPQFDALRTTINMISSCGGVIFYVPIAASYGALPIDS